MNKSNLYIVIATIGYTYLFFQQSIGANFAAFTILMSLLIIVNNGSILKNKEFLFCLAGTLLSGGFVIWHGSVTAAILNIFSWGFLSILATGKNSSFVNAGLHAIYSLHLSLMNLLVNFSKRLFYSNNQPAGKSSGTATRYSITAIIAITFLILYLNSNTTFYKVASKINLSFISIDLILFTCLGFILVHPLIKPQLITTLLIFDKQGPNDLNPQRYTNTSQDSIIKEVKMGVLIFAVLNLLLLSVNAVDIIYLWAANILPDGLTYAEFVHQGIGSLITSIILAISLILYFFRGELNFFEKNSTLKPLAIIWIVQNAFLVISTAYRNQLYIDEFSLTHKRIGVYIYLTLALTGLVLTFVKIVGKKSNWFLIRSNAWAFYAILIAYCAFNWDVIITRNNIHQAVLKNKTLDVGYLLTLNSNNLVELIKLDGRTPNLGTGITPQEDIYYSDRLTSEKQETTPNDLIQEINLKSKDLMRLYKYQDWQSFTFDKQNTYKILSTKLN